MLRTESERRTRRIEVNGQLGILPLAIANISDADLASSSVDAVVTDPPYTEVSIPLYGDLGRFAMRVLKPGGWCISMVADFYLGRISRLMTQSGLIERGSIVAALPGCYGGARPGPIGMGR